MSNTFYTADPHFGHANIILYSKRPFYEDEDTVHDSRRGLSWANKDIAQVRVTEMDQTIIKNWNSVVGPKDEVWVLGDFCFGDIYFAKEILLELNGFIKFIFGNHDSTMRRLRTEMHYGMELTELRDKIRFEGELTKARIEGQDIVMCHYPLMTWEKKHHGTWMLHGHCHYNLPVTRVDSEYGKILDVALEGNNYRPYAHEEIAMIMDRRPIMPSLVEFQDHHTPSRKKNG